MHEGSHAADESDWVKSGFSPSLNINNYTSESRAFHVEQSVAEASTYGPLGFYIGQNRVYIWKPGWRGEQVDAAIQSLIRAKHGVYAADHSSKLAHLSTTREETTDARKSSVRCCCPFQCIELFRYVGSDAAQVSAGPGEAIRLHQV